MTRLGVHGERAGAACEPLGLRFRVTECVVCLDLEPRLLTAKRACAGVNPSPSPRR